MILSKYSRGPWKWKKSRTQLHLQDAEGRGIGLTMSAPHKNDLPHVKANADLIEIAPELLEELKKCQVIALAYSAGDISAAQAVGQLQDLFVDLHEIERETDPTAAIAIAEATGENHG